ncbi:MAG: hypothetical protein ACM3X3_09940 [Betaproteobacteria bacterium]
MTGFDCHEEFKAPHHETPWVPVRGSCEIKRYRAQLESGCRMPGVAGRVLNGSRSIELDMWASSRVPAASEITRVSHRWNAP